MKLVGEVEIIEESTNNIIAKESNILVDGAGQLICDVLTAPPALLNNANTSAILDTSNYTIRALSFGKDGRDINANSPATTKAVPFLVSSIQSGHASVHIPVFVSSFTTSSYRPDNRLPKAPTPLDKYLDTDLTFSGLEVFDYASFRNQIGVDNISTNPNLSGLSAYDFGILSSYNYRSDPIEGFPTGQLCNLISYYNEVCAAQLPPFENPPYPASSVRLLAYRIGCFQTLDSGGPLITVFDNSAILPYASSIITKRQLVGFGFGNTTISSMDYKGFASIGNLSTIGNIVLDVPSDYLTTLQLKYRIRFNKNDLLCCAAYGGFTSMGLWGIDMKKTLKKAQPPFNWHPVYHPFVFRLFAKKVFSRNLAYLTERIRSGGTWTPDNLTITWKLQFKE